MVRVKIKVCLIILSIMVVSGCGADGPEITRVEARVATPITTIAPGEHALSLGGLQLINGTISWRDGILYVPRLSQSREPLPLLVWMHGGSGDASDVRHMFPLAEEHGVVILTLDSRHNTWDGIDSPFGPDVQFIDAALRHTFERVAIDPARIGLGGLSDGASYALALGRSNGDLFSHLIAVAPWFLTPPSPPIGQPAIYVAHGIRDNVYNVRVSRHLTVPRLRDAGYDVTYLEFDGPHWVPEPVVNELLKWLKH